MSLINDGMETRQTAIFTKWLKSLKDKKVQSIIAYRLARVEAGLMGDVKSVGDGVSELRIDFGPGYRVYFTKRGQKVIFLLNGGDKASQQRDIAKAKEMAAQIP